MRSKNKNNSVKKLAVAAILSVLLAVFVAAFVFCFFFVDLKPDREIIVIPDFAGMNVQDVFDTEKIKVECEPIFSDSVAEGVIISQEPYAGARRKLAQGYRYTVKLIYSLGKEAYEIPDLCGYSCADAKIALRKLGATVRIVYVYDELADPDRVMRISPAAGKSIEPYDKVTIFVSRDQVEKPVKVRDFCGMTKESACLRILADGLLVGKIAEEYRENGEVGTVISQSIAKGCYVKKGSEIDITVISQKTIEDAHPFGRYITEENGEINGSED